MEQIKQALGYLYHSTIALGKFPHRSDKVKLQFTLG